MLKYFNERDKFSRRPIWVKTCRLANVFIHRIRSHLYDDFAWDLLARKIRIFSVSLWLLIYANISNALIG